MSFWRLSVKLLCTKWISDYFFSPQGTQERLIQTQTPIRESPFHVLLRQEGVVLGAPHGSHVHVCRAQ